MFIVLTVSAAPSMSSLSLMADGKTRDCIGEGVLNPFSFKACKTLTGTNRPCQSSIPTIINSMNRNMS